MSRVNRVGAAPSSTEFVYNVTAPQYGASTAATDNTSAIQAAIDAASANGGGVVYIPSGTFLCNGTVYRKSHVWIEGDGYASCLKLAASASGLASVAKTDLSANGQAASAATSSFPLGPFISHALTGGTVEGGGLRNIRIDGNGANQADNKSYANIFTANTSGMVLENVWSHDARPGLTTSGNQRAYCLFVCDSSKGTVIGGNYYTSGYDAIGERYYALDWQYIGVTASQSDASGSTSRAAFQTAYQNQRTRLISCTFTNANTLGATDKAAVIIHGSQQGTMEGCTCTATNGSALLLFGDNNDGTDDSNWDGPSPAYPSLTADNIAEKWRFVGNRLEGNGAAVTLQCNYRYVRDNVWENNHVLKSTVNGNLIVFDCDYNATLNPTAYTGSRRNRFYNNILENQKQGSICVAEYAHYIAFEGNALIRTTGMGGHFFLFYGCRSPRVVGNRAHMEAASGNFNRFVSLEHYTQNSQTETCSGAVVEGNTISRQEGSTAQVASYVIHTATTACNNVRVVNNIWDIAPATGYIVAIQPLGTGWQVDGNVGLVTENKGTATITAAATSVTVTHGLTAWRTLTAADFKVVGTNTTTTAIGPVSVQNVTSTQFDIVCTVAPGVSTATFAWTGNALLV